MSACEQNTTYDHGELFMEYHDGLIYASHTVNILQFFLQTSYWRRTPEDTVVPLLLVS